MQLASKTLVEVVMHRKFVVGLVVGLVGLLLAPVPGLAQAPALSAAEQNTFADLDVRIGDTLIVTTWEAPRMKGILVSLGSDQLTLSVDGSPITLAANEIQRIQRTRIGWILGTVIGAGAGAGLGAVGAEFQPEGESAAGPIIYSTIFGAAIGFGIDALLNIPRTVYHREVRVTVAPILDDEAVGVSVRLGF